MPELSEQQQGLVYELKEAIRGESLDAVKGITDEPALKLDKDNYKLVEKAIQKLKVDKTPYREAIAYHMTHYNHYPNDYTCLLLSQNVYEELEVDSPAYKDPEDPSSRDDDILNNWKVIDIHNPRGDNYAYYGAIYVNEATQQLVLAHRGSVFGFKDSLVRGGSLDTDNISVLKKNIGTALSDQQLAAAEFTARALELVNKGGDYHGYSLTFTGHSLGGWLAQLSTFYASHSRFANSIHTRAVTFDAPGTKEMMEKLQQRHKKIDLESLDIVDYVSSSPNIVNACNEHPVRPYKIGGVIEFESFLSILKDTQKMGYSAMGHKSELIRKAFDPEKGKPKEYSVIEDWPSIQYKGDNSQALIKLVRKAPSTPLLKTVFEGLLDKSLGMVDQFAPVSLVNILAEFIEGDIHTEEFLTLFDKLKNDYTERDDLTFQKKYELSFINKMNVKPSDGYTHSLPVGEVDPAEQRGIKKQNGYIKKVLEAAKYSSSLSLLTEEVVDKFSEQIEKVENGYKIKVKDLMLHQLREQATYINEVIDEGLENQESNNQTPTLATHIPEGNLGDSKKFTQRIGPWEQLERLFREQRNSNEGKLAIIHGRPGTGKTTLSVEYAKENFDIVRQIKGVNSEDGIYQEYLNLARQLGIKTNFKGSEDLNIASRTLGFQGPQKKSKAEEIEAEKKFLVSSVHTKLKQIIDSGKSIVALIDDLPFQDAYKTAESFFSNLRTNGVNIIITTQHNNVAPGINKEQRIKLEGFSNDEAKEYLANNINGLQQNEINELFELTKDTTQNFPQVLKAVVGYFKKDTDITCGEYKNKYEQAKEALSYGDINLEPAYKVLLDSIIDKITNKETPEEVKKENLEAWKLLQYLEYLSPTAIPTEIFMEISGLNFAQAKSILYSKSLITSGSGRGFLNTHQIVQDGIKQYREYLSKTRTESLDEPSPELLDEKEVAGTLLGIMKDKLSIFADDDFRQTIGWQNKLAKAESYIPHAQKLLEQSQGYDEHTEQLYFRLGKYYEDILIDCNQALRYYYNAMSISIKVLGENHSNTATLYNNIGGVYSSQGNYDKALEYYHEALSIFEEVLGEKHPDTATSYSNIGLAYNSKCDYDKALEYHHKALRVRKEVLGEDDPDTANSYGNIVVVYESQGNYKQALEHAHKALSIVEEALREKYPNITHSHAFVRSVMARLGHPASNLNSKVKADEGQDKRNDDKDDASSGEGSSGNTASASTSSTQQAGTQDSASNKSQSDGTTDSETPPSKSAVLAVTDEIGSYGDNSVQAAIYCKKISEKYSSQGDYDKALEFLYETLTISKELLGEGNPNLFCLYNNIGTTLLKQNEYTEALTYFNKALDILKKQYEGKHEQIAVYYHEISEKYRTQRDYVKASEFLYETLAISKELLGETHISLFYLYNNIGTMYFRQSEYTEALTYFNKSLDILRRQDGGNYLDTSTVYYNVGVLYYSQGNYKQAYKYLWKSLSPKVLGENHPSTLYLFENLSAVCSSAKQKRNTSHELGETLDKILSNKPKPARLEAIMILRETNTELERAEYLNMCKAEAGGGQSRHPEDDGDDAYNDEGYSSNTAAAPPSSTQQAGTLASTSDNSQSDSDSGNKGGGNNDSETPPSKAVLLAVVEKIESHGALIHDERLKVQLEHYAKTGVVYKTLAPYVEAAEAAHPSLFIENTIQDGTREEQQGNRVHITQELVDKIIGSIAERAGITYDEKLAAQAQHFVNTGNVYDTLHAYLYPQRFAEETQRIEAEEQVHEHTQTNATTCATCAQEAGTFIEVPEVHTHTEYAS